MTSPDLGLAYWFTQRATRTPERRAMTFEGSSWTYAQMLAHIEALAGRLVRFGVTRGDRVAFLGTNQPAFLETMFAAARINAIFVPLNFRLTGPELAAIVADSGAAILIVDAPQRPVIEGVRNDLGGVRHLVSLQPADGWQTLEGDGAPLPADFRAAPDDVALLMYTSGTTGRPKGVMLTHANLWWNNTNAILNLDAMQDDVTLVVAPMFHIGGLNVTTLLTLQKGGTIVLERTFDPGRALAALGEHRVTTMFGVPAMFQFMADHPDFAAADLSRVRMLVCGGAPCPPTVLRRWGERGVPVQQGYGLTETAPMVSFLAPEFAQSKLGSCGRMPLFTEVRLVDADGRVVRTPGAQGEVQVRGPNVTKGYWNQPEATAAAIDADGWFRTGDAATMDADGFLTICDRIKDMIITGAENVYSAEVEGVLFKHAAIADVAVIGVPDAKWGEAIVAVAVLRPGTSLTIEDLRDFASATLARYKLPSRLELLPVLPRNTVGKVLKFELRKQFSVVAEPV